MQWAISNAVGAVGWISGLACLKGGLPLAATSFSLFGQGNLAMGTVLCAGGAGVLLWSNLAGQ